MSASPRPDAARGFNALCAALAAAGSAAAVAGRQASVALVQEKDVGHAMLEQAADDAVVGAKPQDSSAVAGTSRGEVGGPGTKWKKKGLSKSPGKAAIKSKKGAAAKREGTADAGEGAGVAGLAGASQIGSATDGGPGAQVQAARAAAAAGSRMPLPAQKVAPAHLPVFDPAAPAHLPAFDPAPVPAGPTPLVPPFSGALTWMPHPPDSGPLMLPPADDPVSLLLMPLDLPPPPLLHPGDPAILLPCPFASHELPLSHLPSLPAFGAGPAERIQTPVPLEPSLPWHEEGQIPAPSFTPPAQEQRRHEQGQGQGGPASETGAPAKDNAAHTEPAPRCGAAVILQPGRCLRGVHPGKCGNAGDSCARRRHFCLPPSC